MIRETGLEAGDAIDGERSCFKASSGNHSESGVTLIGMIIPSSGAYASFFCVLSPKYSQFLLPEPRNKKG
jgi:hypothetical protein